MLRELEEKELRLAEAAIEEIEEVELKNCRNFSLIPFFELAETKNTHLCLT
jgi:hypothetical protein